jgi:hypothetical protein
MLSLLLVSLDRGVVNPLTQGPKESHSDAAVPD